MAPEGKNLPRPKGFNKEQWRKLSRSQQSTQIALANQQAAQDIAQVGFGTGDLEDKKSLPNTTVNFLGVPGGRQYNPNTGTYDPGYAPGTLRKRIPTPTLYGVDQLIGPELEKFPKYLDGDEAKPGSELSFDQIKDLQLKMAQAGYYPKTASYVLGKWDIYDMAAYKDVLSGANANFMDANEYLDYILAHPELRVKDEGAADERLPLRVTLTDPDTIRTVAENTAKSLFGRHVKLPPGMVDQMIVNYQQLERESQTKYYDLGVIGGEGGEIISPPTPSEYATQQIENRYPVQTQADEFTTAMDSVLSAFTTTGVAR